MNLHAKTDSSPKSILHHHFATSHAFVIGINEYSSFTNLKNACNDAQLIAETLSQAVHDYTVHPPLLNATYAEIKALLETTLPEVVKKNDRVVFYFAGHGIASDSDQEGQPEGYLLPSDAQRNDSAKSIPMSQLRVALEALACRHVFLLLDCCFSGAFKWAKLDNTRGSFGSAISIPKKIYHERFDRYVVDSAWQVLTSSAYDQEALDGVYAKPIGTSRNSVLSSNSPFALHLAKALKGAADLIPKGQPNGLITATEIYLYIREQIEKETISLKESLRQTPGFFTLSKHDKGEYLFLSPQVKLNLPGYDPTLNPYKGLEAYELKDADQFFGRDEQIEQLSQFVDKHPISIIAGASGTGKSSLVKAGLLPLLKEQGYELLLMRPGTQALTTLKLVLPSLSFDESRKQLLVIDQLEELITQCHDKEEREAFIAAIYKLTRQGASESKIILTIRSDFEPQFEKSLLKSLWQSARFVVPGFTNAELREVIERPAIQRIILFDPPEMVEQIIQEVQNAPGALPLLSFTMSEMYEKLKLRGEFGAFKWSDYQALGGVIGALRTSADHLLHSLDRPHQTTMQKIMLRMVSQEGGELAKQRVLEKDLVFRAAEENKRVSSILNALTEARLIVRGKDLQGQSYVEPAHDALVRAWGTLWSWITAIGKGKLILLNNLQEACTEYERTKTKKDLWHNNTRLDAVNEEKEHWLNATEIAFVQKSLNLRKRNRNRLVASLLSFIIVLSGLSIWALNQSSQAQEALAKDRESNEAYDEALVLYEKANQFSFLRPNNLDEMIDNCQHKKQLKMQFDQWMAKGDSLKQQGAHYYPDALVAYQKANELHYDFGEQASFEFTSLQSEIERTVEVNKEKGNRFQEAGSYRYALEAFKIANKLSPEDQDILRWLKMTENKLAAPKK